MMKYFPISKLATDIFHFIVVILAYIAVLVVVDFAIDLLGWIPLVKTILHIVGWVIKIYCVAGIVVTCLSYFKIIK